MTQDGADAGAVAVASDNLRRLHFGAARVFDRRSNHPIIRILGQRLEDGTGRYSGERDPLAGGQSGLASKQSTLPRVPDRRSDAWLGRNPGQIAPAKPGQCVKAERDWTGGMPQQQLQREAVIDEPTGGNHEFDDFATAVDPAQCGNQLGVLDGLTARETDAKRRRRRHWTRAHTAHDRSLTEKWGPSCRVPGGSLDRPFARLSSWTMGLCDSLFRHQDSDRILLRFRCRGLVRRSPVLLAGIALLLALAGCSNEGQDQVHLIVGTSWRGPGIQTLRRELLAAASELGPVTVEVRSFSNEGLHDVLLHSQPRTGQGSLDLAIVPDQWIAELAQRDLLVELPAGLLEPLQQQLVGQAVIAVTIAERAFAFPLSAEVPALVYDPTSFPSPPRTIDELIDAPLPPAVLSFACDLQRPEFVMPFITSLHDMRNDAEGLSRSIGAAMGDAIQRLSRGWRAAGTWRAFQGDDVESLQVQMFAEHRLASFIAGPWLLPALENIGRPFLIIPIPGFAGAPNPARALVSYQCAVVNRQSQWADLALALGARLLRSDVNVRINRASGRLPVLLATYNAQRDDSSSNAFGFLRALDEGQPTGVPPSSDVLKRLGELLANLANRTEPPTPDELRALFQPEGTP